MSFVSFGYRESTVSGTQLQCNTCNRSFSRNETHLDLTVASGSKQYNEPMPLSTELFRWMICFNGFLSQWFRLCSHLLIEIFLVLLIYRTPLVSFLYERGWRQNFIWGGFPGPEKEVRWKNSLVLQKACSLAAITYVYMFLI